MTVTVMKLFLVNSTNPHRNTLEKSERFLTHLISGVCIHSARFPVIRMGSALV